MLTKYDSSKCIKYEKLTLYHTEGDKVALYRSHFSLVVCKSIYIITYTKKKTNKCASYS